MAYQRILVALELTDEAEPVFAAALAQAAQHSEAALHLVNVVRPLSHVLAGLDTGGHAVAPSLESDMHKHATKTLNNWAAKRNIPQSAVHVRTGNAAAEIRQCAEKINADLIVIGTHGQHGLGLLLGSTANGVLHGVNCDVLTIRIR